MPALSAQVTALRNRAIVAQHTFLVEDPTGLAIGVIIASAKRSGLHALYPLGDRRGLRWTALDW
jgi:hypothetical protein